jgi:hypothetical protein
VVVVSCGYCAAMIDRIVHHAEVPTLKGSSYRAPSSRVRHVRNGTARRGNVPRNALSLSAWGISSGCSTSPIPGATTQPRLKGALAGRSA